MAAEVVETPKALYQLKKAQTVPAEQLLTDIFPNTCFKNDLSLMSGAVVALFHDTHPERRWRRWDDLIHLHWWQVALLNWLYEVTTIAALSVGNDDRKWTFSTQETLLSQTNKQIECQSIFLCEGHEVTWETIAVQVETTKGYTSSYKAGTKAAFQRLALGAQAALRAQPTRHRFIGVTWLDRWVQIHCFDRDSVKHSAAFDFHINPDQFAIFLVAILAAPASVIGFGKPSDETFLQIVTPMIYSTLEAIDKCPILHTSSPERVGPGSSVSDDLGVSIFSDCTDLLNRASKNLSAQTEKAIPIPLWRSVSQQCPFSQDSNETEVSSTRWTQRSQGGLSVLLDIVEGEWIVDH